MKKQEIRLVKSNGKYYFKVIEDGTNLIVASTGYKSKKSCIKSMKSIAKLINEAEIIEIVNG